MLALAFRCLELINQLKPQYWFIENPRGMLRKQNFMPLYKVTLTYCKYGAEAQKPTDIWTNAFNWIPKKMCKPGDSCHAFQPRSYHAKLDHKVRNHGIQGLSSAFERGMIPKELCEEIVKVCEGKQNIKQTILEGVYNDNR